MIAAIRRLGGYDFVVQKLGFIPYNQWNYFCRFYLLTKVCHLKLWVCSTAFALASPPWRGRGLVCTPPW
jgi:hypothetical protein